MLLKSAKMYSICDFTDIYIYTYIIWNGRCFVYLCSTNHDYLDQWLTCTCDNSHEHCACNELNHDECLSGGSTLPEKHNSNCGDQTPRAHVLD